MAPFLIRSATRGDAPSLLDIYRPFVVSTPVSFELTPPSVEEFGERIDRALGHWAWLVAERDRHPIGYAYATSHRSRGAYRWSVETSVYLHEASRGQGIGSALYQALMPVLADRGYCNAYAGITVPNDASVALHRRAGFEAVGVFRSVGRKFGRWHDVAWWHLRLRPDPPDERSPR